jgi:putative NIF3 family GTP cyclohydrolase 1 type 2
MVAPRSARADVVAAMIAAHPYEEVAYDVLELADRPSSTGLGRVGELEREMTLDEFADRTRTALPVGAAGIRVAGDPGQMVRTVAVCGGSGDSLLGAASASGADVYVTGDLRHHRAGDHAEDGGPALIDATHYGTEWPWLAQAARLLVADLAAAGTTVDARVSSTVTDPWAFHKHDQ